MFFNTLNLISVIVLLVHGAGIGSRITNIEITKERERGGTFESVEWLPVTPSALTHADTRAHKCKRLVK